MPEEEDDCEVPVVLRAGVSDIGPMEVHGEKYNPGKIGGLGLGDGDTQGGEIHEVPDC
jgi:hypothetical protein